MGGYLCWFPCAPTTGRIREDILLPSKLRKNICNPQRCTYHHAMCLNQTLRSFLLEGAVSFFERWACAETWPVRKFSCVQVESWYEERLPWQCLAPASQACRSETAWGNWKSFLARGVMALLLFFLMFLSIYIYIRHSSEGCACQ